MSSINKIVLKGTSRISLHERFTKLKFDTGRASAQAAPPAASSLVYKHTPIPVKIEDGGYIRSDHLSARRRPSYSPPPARRTSRPRNRTPDQPRYAARRMRSLSPMERIRKNISPDVTRRSRYDDRTPNLFSTNRVQKKSVYLRLGVKPRSLADRMADGIPVWAQARQSSWGGRGVSRSQSSHSLNRWNSQGSLENSYDVPRYQMNNNNRRFRGGRGGRRNFAYNQQGRWRYSQGWFGGRGRRGGRGYRGGGNNRYNNNRGGGGGWTSRFQQRRAPPAKREDLDAELDAYMANTRGVLDNQIDSYMQANTRS